jgi:hypothetical protein
MALSTARFFRVSTTLMVITAVASSCGKSGVFSTGVSEALTNAPACNNFRDQLFNSLYAQVQSEGTLRPTFAAKGELASGGSARLQALKTDLYSSVYRSVTAALPTATMDSEANQQTVLHTLAEIELGDRTTPEKDARQTEFEAKFAKLAAEAKTTGVPCVPVPGTPVVTGGVDSVPIFETFRQTKVPVIYGAYKTFSMAYQTCNMLDSAPLTSASSPVEGITVIGHYPGGIGLERAITDPAAVFRSNPFYAGRRTPAGGCLPAQNSPLIYNYGGKPYVASSSAMELSLFKNGGSGSSSLGIDCSGFVSTALVAAGLRVKQGTANRAYLVGGINSAMLANPQSNGLTCLNKFVVSPSNDLAAGDIVTIPGHVVLIGRIGPDPLGLARAKSLSQCTTSVLNSAGFDFTLIQSSASKGGIGINRFVGADYLAGVSSLRIGLEDYAVALCRSRFGQTPAPAAYSATIIRHSGTAACTDSRVTFASESCMKDCS